MLPPQAIDASPSSRGFITAVESSRVTDFYRQRQDRTFNTDTWEHKKEGLLLAKDCFSLLTDRNDFNGFKYWLMEQSKKSNYFYGRRYDFLVDTLTFINTGKRSTTVDNWYELLEDWVEPNRSLAGRNPPLPAFSFNSVNEVICQWCSHDNGFYDMICTLNILFGESRTTDKPQEKISIGRSPLSVRPE